MTQTDPNSGWTGLTHRVGPILPPLYPVHRKHKLNSFKGKMIRIFVKCMICVLNNLLHMKMHILNDQGIINEYI